MRERWRAFVRSDGFVPALATVAGMLTAVAIFGFFLVPYAVQGNFDEGFEAAVVERIIDGRGLPYVDGVAHRGPFLYWTQAIVHLIVGRFGWAASRVLATLCCVTTMGATFLAGWAAEWPLAGAIGALGHAFILATVYDTTGVGVVSETVAIAYLTTAFFLVAASLYRARTRKARRAGLFAAGIVLAMAGLSKQTVAIACMPMFLWILVHHLGDVDDPTIPAQERLPWARAFKEGVLPFAAGGVLLVLLVLARYALAGELGTFFFWSVTFNAKHYMGPYKGRIMLQLWQWFVHDARALACVLLALIVMIGPAAGRLQSVSVRGVLRALRASGFEVVVGLMVLTVLFAAAYPLRIWQHYFVPLWPFVGLLLGIAIDGMVVRQAVRPRVARAAAALLCAGVVVVSGTQRFGENYLRRSQGEWPDPRRDPACDEIDRIAGPGKDGIFIWGTIGDLYVSCRRRSVSKFTYTTIIAGIIPPFWNQPDPKNIAPGSRETLLAELAANRPPVIIDFPISPGNAMVNIPELRAVLNERYCRASVKRDLHGRELTFFARRDLPACVDK